MSATSCWPRSTRSPRRPPRAPSPRSAASCARCRTAAERVEQELRRSRDRNGQLAARIAELERVRDGSRHDCAATELLEAPLVDDIQRAEQRTAGARQALATAVERRAALAEDVSTAAARVEALQLALDLARARAGADRLAGLDGVLGTLLDLVRIDPGWEPAVEAALGEALASVVVDDTENAARALRALAQSDTAGAVLALGAASATVEPAPLATADAEAIRPHVSADRADIARLLDALLARAVRVESIDAAIDVAVAHPTAVVVTHDGHRLAGEGWRVGAAASGGATAAALDEATSAPRRRRAGLRREQRRRRATRRRGDRRRATRSAGVGPARRQRPPVHDRRRRAGAVAGRAA